MRGTAKNAPKLAELVAKYGDTVKVAVFAPDESDPTAYQYAVYFDDPAMFAACKGLSRFNLEIAALACKINDETGNQVKTVAVHIGDDGKLVWGKSAASGTRGERGQLAKGYKVTASGAQYESAEETCKALGIVPTSKDPNGTPYYAAALVKEIKAGRVERIY
jgi:hypothetical protein